VTRDIDERKKMEDELRRAKDAAEAATRSKSQFLATISHEIRIPMTSILGYADLLLDPTVNASTRNNYAATIRRSGENLLVLINDILDISKIEAGKMGLEIAPCKVVSLLADVASVMRPRAKMNNISFAVECKGSIPETISTDGARLRQIILNLVGNAVKFTEKGGVRIIVSFLEKGKVFDDQAAVQFQVIDTGIGIHEEILKRLFQPFVQGDTKITQRFGGTGLGLAISRHLAQMLGGDLSVESVWEEGSTFTLTVPTGDLEGVRLLECPNEVVHETKERVWQKSEKGLEGIEVLLVEDGLDNQRLIQAVLVKAGATVKAVENGRMAVDEARNQTFDVILMDMNMPVMDGYEATSVLRDQGYPGPILALTANAMKEDRERCCLAGCDDYLTKPIDRALLIQAVKQYANVFRATMDQPASDVEP
jgi:Amt family ammonium transporter